MAMLFLYPSKKNMRENIGKPLKYEETSVFGPEYLTDGELYGSNRPSHTGIKTDIDRDWETNVFSHVFLTRI